MFFIINFHSMHVERTNTSEVQPDALQERQISSRGGRVSPGRFSPLVLKLPFSPSSPPAIGSTSDSEGGRCPHLPLCLLMTPLLSTQPPSPATLLAFSALVPEALGLWLASRQFTKVSSVQGCAQRGHLVTPLWAAHRPAAQESNHTE